MSRRVVPALVVATAVLAVMAPIAVRGSPLGDDAYFHTLWAGQFGRSLASGILYPRWLPDVNGGLGNPTFVFYPPLLYYAAFLLEPLGGSVPRALDLAAGAALLVSGTAAYAYLRRGLPIGGAVLGAVALVTLPYPLLDLYDRTALAELAAFAWPPLALAGLHGLGRARTPREAALRAAGVAGATAALALTHLPSLVLWGPLLAAAALAAGRGGRRAGAARAIGALALGLGLAAVYLVPVAAERRFVQSEWLALPGPAPLHTLFSSDVGGVNATVSRIACWQAALAAVAAAAALWPGAGRPWRIGRRRGALPVAGAAVLSAAAFLLMTPSSRPLWSALPLLPQVQFPWRLLVVLTPAAALLAACAAVRAASPASPPAARGLAAAALLLLGANLVVSARDVVAPAALDTRTAARYGADPEARRDAPEYRPRGAPVGRLPVLPRAASLAERGHAEVLAWEPGRRVVAVDARERAWLRIATFHYPGWHAEADGRALPIRAGPDGVIEVLAPAGRHVVEISFGTTPARRAGLALSLASGLGLAVWVAAGYARTAGAAAAASR